MIETRNSSLLGKITVVLIVGCLSLSVQAKYGGGTGEPNDPYLIYTAEQMNEIGLSGNWDDWDKHFKLMVDVDLGQFTGEEFNIIGNSTTKFTGIFDGNGHTISNFRYTSTNVHRKGLFGMVGSGGEIKNLGLTNVNVDAGMGSLAGGLVGENDGTVSNCYATGSITGRRDVGGLVGGNWGGTVSNCYATASIFANDYLGGLAGSNVGGLVGSSSGTVSNCYATGTVTGVRRVGGLVGDNDSTVSNCYATGTVTGDGGTVGGLVGDNDGMVSNCYATGSATVGGDGDVGGLVGDNDGMVSNCYATGTVTGTGRSVGGLVGINYYGRVSNCYATGSVTGGGGADVGGLVGFSWYADIFASFWDTQTTGQIAGVGVIEGSGMVEVYDRTTAEMQTESTFTDYGWGCEPVWTIDDGNDYPHLVWEGQPGELMVRPEGLYAGGSGTETDPYLIETAEQLNAIGIYVCDFDKDFKLMADIDLSGYAGTAFNIIGIDWANSFTGVFDGNGHTISNFTYTSTRRDYIGFFGYVGTGGEIKDLGLTNVNVDAGVSGYVGGLVGANDGTVSNCYATGSVAGGEGWDDWDVGGLVGANWDGTISNSFFAGTARGRANVGGLVGGNHGTVSNCFATGNVSGTSSNVGGLVGQNYGTVSNCQTTGGVSGTGNVGGLVGYNYNGGAVSNCYATGSVSGTSNVGGLVGRNYNYATVTASFWDIETSEQTTSDGGTGLQTAEMQMQITFTYAGWDFNTPVWTIDEGVDYPRLWWEFVPVLHTEPEVTLGTSNTISWEPVVGDVEYYAECGEDEKFTSIIYNSGWITETSYEFTGLELGKRYWYSVKARNSAGIESQWSNVESSLQVTLADAVDIMLAPNNLKSKNLKKPYINKIKIAQDMIDSGNFTGALSKLENDILPKTDGCAKTGEPDKSDWIITCEGQSEVYRLVIETIENVRSLMQY